MKFFLYKYMNFLQKKLIHMHYMYAYEKERVLYKIREKFGKLKKQKHFSQITQFSVIVLLLVVLPLGNLNLTKPQNYQTNISFDKNSFKLLTSENRQVSIEIAESRYTLENAKKLAAETTTENRVYFRDNPEVLRPLYQEAANEFGIQWQLIEAVHEVESGKSGSTAVTSYAGAQGPMQFMPGTWRAYAIDGDKDGDADIHDLTDSIFTAAHYLARSGADENRIDDALFNYNHSYSYVNKVKNIALEIGLEA